VRATYLALECKRLATGRRFWIFSLSLPVLLYLLESSAYGHSLVPGTEVDYPAYLMCSFAAWGAIHAALIAGGRVAVERSTGWQRQLRLTPLPPSGYLLGKVVVGLLATLPPPVVLAVVGGALFDVDLPAPGWARLVLGMWVASLPFAVLGTLLGQLARRETIAGHFGPALLLLGFLGGLVVPAPAFPEWLQQAAKSMPSYWLADIARGALRGSHVHLPTAVAVLAAWTLALGLAVIWRHRRDTGP
jgi:ABC-2 type transport system permease protein